MRRNGCCLPYVQHCSCAFQAWSCDTLAPLWNEKTTTSETKWSWHLLIVHIQHSISSSPFLSSDRWANCNWRACRLCCRNFLTRKSVFRQRVQTAGCHSWLVFSICWEATQSILCLGGGLIPPAQRWVRLQWGNLVERGAEEGGGKLRRRRRKARGIWGAETHRCVGEIGGYGTLDWILVREQ